MLERHRKVCREIRCELTRCKEPLGGWIAEIVSKFAPPDRLGDARERCRQAL